jgi:hypothetical protein
VSNPDAIPLAWNRAEVRDEVAVVPVDAVDPVDVEDDTELAMGIGLLNLYRLFPQSS